MLGLLSSLRATELASAVRWCQPTASTGSGSFQLQPHSHMQRRVAHLTAYSESLNACSDCPVFRVLSDASFSARMRASFLPARCSGSQQAVWAVRSSAHAVLRQAGLGLTNAVQVGNLHSSNSEQGSRQCFKVRTHALSASRTSRALAAGALRTRGTTPSRPIASLRTSSRAVAEQALYAHDCARPGIATMQSPQCQAPSVNAAWPGRCRRPWRDARSARRGDRVGTRENTLHGADCL